MRTHLRRKELAARGTMAFYFEIPEGFSYQAGQSVDLTLPNAPVADERGKTRAFSLASAPYEPELMITTRLRDSAFKKILRDLPEGSELVMDGPFGSFFLHENAKRPAVFIAGGIGITPFRSMIADATERQLPHRITLFDANRTKDDAPFLGEFRAWEKKNNHFTFVPVFTKETGHLTADQIKKSVNLDVLPIFYIAGPPMLVLDMRKTLNSIGVSNDDIKFEEFTGY